jgi:prevent-host-death family protein
MAIINMHDAKTQLSDLVARAEAGEEIVIARRNKPAVRLIAVKDTKEDVREMRKRIPGRFAHLRTTMSEADWLAPLPEDELQAWEGKAGFGEEKPAGYDAGGLREALEQGKEYTIMKDGKPVAKVVPIEPEPKSRGWGAWEGRYALPDTFFDPLPEEELRAWDGSDEPAA